MSGKPRAQIIIIILIILLYTVMKLQGKLHRGARHALHAFHPVLHRSVESLGVQDSHPGKSLRNSFLVL